MKVVCLCGGINGLSDAEAKDWREQAKAAFKDKLFVLDPMRRDYRGKEDESVSAIVRGDLADIEKSDVLLVNAARPSWGTAMEVHAAFVCRTAPSIIAVVPEGQPVSPWLRYHCKAVVPTLEAGIALVLKEFGE